MKNHIFISYRHESTDHARAVRRLGELLRQAKLPVELDQFYLEDHPGGPDEGWPKWCEDNANESACVLIIASEGWFAAYDKTAQPGIGLGAATEADLFRQEFYDKQGNNARIRLVFLHELSVDKVPPRLKPWHKFQPFNQASELDGLIHWIAERLNLQAIESPTVRWPEPIQFQPDLANRNLKEWPAIIDLLSGKARERILIYEGCSGVGKSFLISQAAHYAKMLGIRVVRVDFKVDADISSVLGKFDLELGDALPNFSREGASKTHLLRKDLRNLRQPVLLIFDTYDEPVVLNKPLADWFSQNILNEVETSPSLAVIVAGQKSPDFANASWRDFAKPLPLEPITKIEHWEPWIDRRYPGLHEKGDLQTVLKLAGGNPAVVSSFCEALSKS